MAKITSVKLKNDKTKDIIDSLNADITVALQAIGQEAEGFAKDECPVDTGTLRNSISNKVLKKTVYVGTNIEYAVYVEYGDYKHTVGNKHFLKNSVENNLDRFQKILEAYLKAQA